MAEQFTGQVEVLDDSSNLRIELDGIAGDLAIDGREQRDVLQGIEDIDEIREGQVGFRSGAFGRGAEVPRMVACARDRAYPSVVVVGYRHESSRGQPCKRGAKSNKLK